LNAILLHVCLEFSRIREEERRPAPLRR
jgi:hypothetical protein